MGQRHREDRTPGRTDDFFRRAPEENSIDSSHSPIAAHHDQGDLFSSNRPRDFDKGRTFREQSPNGYPLGII